MTAGDPVVREYRRRADECRAQVEKTKGEYEKGKWLNLAAKWDDLAEDAERRQKDRMVRRGNISITEMRTPHPGSRKCADTSSQPPVI